MVRVAIAHDYLNQRGGAERVALAMLRSFPGSPLYTSVYVPDSTFSGFRSVEVRTSWLQRVEAFRRDPRLAAPLLAPSWKATRVTDDDADAVLASSSGWAHGVSVGPGVKKIVYCHNPARWLYQPEDYFAANRRLGRLFAPFAVPLKHWDRAAALSADRYIANSPVVARRIRETYGIEAEVLPPPVLVDADAEQEAQPGLAPGFYLTVARGRGYKHTSLVEQAIESMPGERLVVVGSGVAQASDEPGSAILRLGIVGDARLRWLYANAAALVSVSFEDFGLTPLEANAFGTPAVALRAGGFLDTIDEGVSGAFVDEPSSQAVRAALLDLPRFDPALVRKHAEHYSEARFQNRLHTIVDEVIAGG